MKKNLYYKTDNEGNVDFADRWNDLKEILEITNNDTVLDVGCAEGLISIEVSKTAKIVDAFDVEPYRIIQAKENAKKARRNNINFRVSSYEDYAYKSYDIVLLLGVYHKIKSKNRREQSLNSMFTQCQKQFYIRVPVISDSVSDQVGIHTEEIETVADKQGFELVFKSDPRYDHGTLFKFKRR
jgi:SAM-dependent methyltransferase